MECFGLLRLIRRISDANSYRSDAGIMRPHVVSVVQLDRIWPSEGCDVSSSLAGGTRHRQGGNDRPIPSKTDCQKWFAKEPSRSLGQQGLPKGLLKQNGVHP